MKKLILLIGVVSSLFFISCNKDNNDVVPENEIVPHAKTNRTVLAYMIGDMNYWYYIEDNINKLEEGWNNNIDGTLLVYLDNSKHLTQFGQPVLLEITHDKSDMIVSKVIKSYKDQDAGDPNVMQNVLNDALTIYPANSHGLIISAHSNGWIPEIKEGNEVKGIVGPERYGSVLEIDQLAKILPIKYDFIIFGACNMSNVETAYQLRDKCDYIMGSAYSFPAYGYPYEHITPYLYTKPYADLYKASKVSSDDYSTNKDSKRFSALTIEVIKTSELENLATATSRLLDDLNMSYDNMIEELYKQREELDGLSGSNYVVDYYYQLLFDLKGLYFLSKNEPIKKAYLDALNRTIIHNYVVAGIDTEQIAKKLQFAIDSEDSNMLGVGLSFYLPYNGEDAFWAEFNSIFKNNYDWSKASGFDKDRHGKK